MDVKIIKKDASEVLLSSLNFKVLDFIVESPTPSHTLENIDGANTLVDLGTTYPSRPIRLKLAYTGTSFITGRNELFKMFTNRPGQETFYIVDMREPTKKWEVKAGAFSLDQLTDNLATVEIPLTSIGPSARAATTSTFTTSSFLLNYEGDEDVDPRNKKLKITYTGASTNLKIKNWASGDEWQYTGTTALNDAIILDGVKATKNGLSIFKDTNRKLIKIKAVETTNENANFVGKIPYSTVENPHRAKAIQKATLATPTEFTFEYATADVAKIAKLDGQVLADSQLGNYMMQKLFSFNLIEHLKRKRGLIVPGATVADQVAWLKANVTNITCNWHGYGSSPSGNKASTRFWDAVGNAWGGTIVTNTSATVTKNTVAMSGANVNPIIDSNGFVHLLAYADASNGTTPSAVRTDFVELEVTLPTGNNAFTLTGASGTYSIKFDYETLTL